MNDNRTFYPRLVLSIEKPWLTVARFSFEVWDQKFATWKMDVMFVTHYWRYKSKGKGLAPYGQTDTVFTDTLKVTDEENGNLEITNAKDFIDIIRRQFSEEVGDFQLDKTNLFHEL